MVLLYSAEMILSYSGTVYGPSVLFSTSMPSSTAVVKSSTAVVKVVVVVVLANQERVLMTIVAFLLLPLV